MNYTTILKPLLRKESYVGYVEYIDYDYLKNKTPELYYVYLTLKEMHEKFSNDLTVEELETYFYVKYPDVKQDMYSTLFDQLRSPTVSDEINNDVINQVIQRRQYLELSELAYALSQGRGHDSLDKYRRLTERLQSPLSTTYEPEFVTDDIESIVNDTIKARGIRWQLDCLNKSIGSIRRGDFGFIFARPESGKTTFVSSFVGNALDQVEQPILWFNNEEVGTKVMMRVYQSYFGVNTNTLIHNVAKYKKSWQERVGHKFKLVDDSGMTRDNIEKTVQAIKPALIVFDQIDKIKGFKADRDDLVYGAIYQWSRELAKDFAPVVGVCQADGTGEGQKWLSMGNVSNAKTSKQAEADWILGIGKTSNAAEEYIRYLNISKNKLIGDEDTRPELRHGRHEVLIEPQIARYKDLVNHG